MKIEITDERLKKIVQHEVGHYVVYLALNMKPMEIEFHFNNEGINGATKVPTDNIFFENIKEVSDFALKQCIELTAGTFAEFIDFDKNLIDKENASFSFMNDFGCSFDFDLFFEHLSYYISSNYLDFKNDPSSETSKKIAMIEIFDKTIEILLANSKIIQKLTNHIFEILRNNKTDIHFTCDELNTIIKNS